MNRQWAGATYSTEKVDDRAAGSVSMMLYRTTKGEQKHVASVTFWDAGGQCYFETFHGDVPLEIVEDLISEAKKQIRIT